MKVTITFDLDDRKREAISAYYGRNRKATAKQCQRFIERQVSSDFEVIIDELDRREEEETDELPRMS